MTRTSTMGWWTAIAVGLIVAAPAAAAPLRITRGGTYSGDWSSDSVDVPAVTIATTEPVIIERSSLRGPGELIAVEVGGADVIVRDTTGTGERPGEQGRWPGRFFKGENLARLTIEHCAAEGTSGIYLLSNRPEARINIRANRFRNIDGRKSDGEGGMSDDFHRVQFVQFDKVREPAEANIVWNEVVNEPGKSRVEDVVSLFRSAGTEAAPIAVRDNFIDGAYPADPASDEYSGGGIMSADGTDGGHVLVADNIVLSTSNYGIAAAGGRDIRITGNRIVADNRLADGTPVASANVGIYVWNMAEDPAWRNVLVADNTVGWLRLDETGRMIRNDLWHHEESPARIEQNEWLPNPVDEADEQAERERWEQKLRDAGVAVGPRPKEKPTP